jgi:DNA-directed RNA polymerase subunit RPC12/RpoP
MTIGRRAAREPDCRSVGKGHLLVRRTTPAGKRYHECERCGYQILFKLCPVCKENVDDTHEHILASTDEAHVVYLVHNS